VVLNLWLASCGSDATHADRVAEQPVGPAGGTVSTGGGVSVEVPPGALAGEVTVTIDALGEIAPPEGTVTFGDAYLLGPEGTTFAEPVKVTLPWSGIVPQGKRVVLARQPAAGGDWVLMTDGAGANETRVWAETTSFSRWVPVIACEAGTVQCTDGLCRPDCSGSCQAPNRVCQVTPTLETCTNVLTDPNHCGACGKACDVTQQCVEGECR
jgi:hypothetical protein